MLGLQYLSSRSNRLHNSQTYAKQMPSTIFVTPSMTYEELFKLWKKRYERYVQKARETLEKNKAQ